MTETDNFQKPVTLMEFPREHQREGFVIAVYLGVTGRMDEQQRLVEIYEHYSLWDNDMSKKLRVRVFDISSGVKELEVQQYPGEYQGDQMLPVGVDPPPYVRRVIPNYWWRRVR